MKKQTQTEVSSKEIFSFSKVLLVLLGLLYISAMLLHSFIDTDTTAEIWDAVSTGISPLISMIIGHYFGQKS